jgi:vancomycin resistance protein YoaR
VDDAASLDLVEAALARRAEGTPVPAVALSVAALQPDFSTAEAEAAAGRVTKISEWTTRYPVGPNNGYGANIRIPAETLDGYVVEPGVTFDFWREIGGVSREKGYLPGAMIQGGTTVEPGEIGPDGKPVEGALAGGICSASTTLFNAALRAGFPIETRRNHYYYISRYPLGLDATVWRNGTRIQTMRWTNDTPWPVLIRGVNGKGWVRFELYSVPTGRTVTLADPVVSDEQEASDSIVFTRNLPEGRTKRAEKPHDGFRVSVERTVRGANGAVIRQDTFTSRYGTVRGVLLVGGEGEDIVFPPGVTARWP